MTTTSLILDRHVAEVVTFPRHDPKEVGAFIDLVAGCDFVTCDDFGFSVQIDPDELHVQVNLPANTAPQEAPGLLQDLVLTGSMTHEMRIAEGEQEESIDARFRKIVERFGESEGPRERIRFIGSSVVEVAEPELEVDSEEEFKLWAGGTDMIIAAVSGFTSEKAGGRGSNELDSTQRDDLRIAGKMMQKGMLAHFGEAEYTFKPY